MPTRDGASHPLATAEPRPATAELRHEHEVILRALDVLDRMADRLAAGRAVDEATLASLVELLRTFADRCHHGKEEDRLFPALRAKGLESTLQVFLDEHATGRALVSTVASGAPAEARAAAARRYSGMLREHILREEEVLFPIADDLLTTGEHETLARQYEEVELEAVGPGVHERLLATLAELEAAVRPAEPGS